MIERFLYTTIKTGFEAVRDTPPLVDDIFAQYDLPTTEIAAIKQILVDMFPTIKHQYARSEDEAPLISIVLGAESEDEHYIGDFAQQEDDGSEIVSAIWNHTYELLVYTEHPDHTLYLYTILKAIFVTAPLSDCGLFQTHLSGADLMPDDKYIPEHLFARRLTFKAQREFESIDRVVALSKAFRVAGMHIDSDGSPRGVGDVKTLVTVDPLEDE